MKGYAAFACDPANPVAMARLAALGERLRRHPTWCVAEAAPGLSLVLEAPDPLKLRRFAGRPGWVLGDLYDARTFEAAPPELPSPDHDGAHAETLLRRYWGRYVALWPRDGRMAALRDPGGALEAVCWRTWGVDVVASSIAEDWMADLAPDLRLDWYGIGRGLAEPLGLSDRVPLLGVEAMPPGGLWRPEGASGLVRRVWTPAQWARGGAPTAEDPVERLAAVVDGCVGAVGRAGGPIVAELSGGLDSAIVAAALTREADTRVRAWVNVHAEDPESDERASARAVADRLGLTLTEIAKPAFAFTDDSLARTPVGLRPSLSSLDHSYDLALTRLCAELGATTLVTGQGGDAVFLQMVTPLALLDRRQLRSGPRAWSRQALAIARASRRSIWSVASSALGGWLRPAPRPAVAQSPFLSRSVRLAGAGAPHPWLDDLRGLDPAKRLHIRALVYAQIAHGESLRGRQADLVHPLMSQPIVELCLALPVYDLTAGGQGRALARAAYRARLPSAVVERRAKGDLTAHYGRALARSLPGLRPWLLDGRLAAQGLLDRPSLEAALTPEHLIWRGNYAEILQLIVLETWVRRWVDRLESGEARRAP